MGTAATVTRVSGPMAPGDGTYEGIFSLALDTTDGTGIQTIDLTAYFDEIYSITLGGNDTLADGSRLFGFILPTVGTAITATNVEISAHWSPAKTGAGEAAEVFDPDTAKSLATVGDMRIVVKGTQAI